MGSAVREMSKTYDINKSNIIIHQGFNGKYGEHDIALLRTPNLEFSRKFFNKINTQIIYIFEILENVNIVRLPSHYPLDIKYVEEIAIGWNSKGSGYDNIKC